MADKPQDIMPHSPEAEMALCGSLLLYPIETLAECHQNWQMGEQVFYDPRHQAVYESVARLVDQRITPTMQMVGADLNESGMLDRIGGYAYLTELCESCTSRVMAEEYAAIVAEKYRIRQFIVTAKQLAIEATRIKTGSGFRFLSDAEKKLLTIDPTGRDKPTMIRDISNKLVDRLELYVNHTGAITGFETGFSRIDKVTAGLQKNALYVIAGRPGTGKTSLALNIAANMASKQVPVGVFSLEMSSDDLAERLLCSMAGINFHKMRCGLVPVEEIVSDDVKQAIKRMRSLPVWIDQSVGMTVHDIRSRMRRLAKQHGVKVFIVDYIQLISLPKEFRGDRVNGMAYVSNQLAATSKELNCPVILVSQLNRASERERKRPPQMADLRDSGAIEQDATFIGILWRPPQTEEENRMEREAVSNSPHANHEYELNLEVAKNRHGPMGFSIRLLFKRWCMKFEDIVEEGKEKYELPENFDWAKMV